MVITTMRRAAPAAATTVSPVVARGAIVFADVVGFTEFTDRNGDTLALALVDALDLAAHDVLPHGARVVKNLGDGVLCWFPDAAQAIETSLRLVERFATATLASPPLRVGVHFGTAVRRGADLVGHDVNVAARLAAAAAPGTVLCSETTWARAAGRVHAVTFERIRPFAVKGLRAPIRALRASAVPPIPAGSY